MSIHHHHNTFYHRIRNVLIGADLPPHTQIAGWRFVPDSHDPTQGELFVWLNRDQPPLVVAQSHVNPNESTGPGLV